jgi:DNA-binding NarL/FixJ family response regulator
VTVSLLIVDDDEDYRLLVRLAVAGDARLEVVGEASTTPEAIELARNIHPDVVLLDLTLRDPHGRNTPRPSDER